ncbi:MAG TPA: penicillin acylase family protein [Pyrinomonadaceae bacterium]|jgi:penicillin amidase
MSTDLPNAHAGDNFVELTSLRGEVSVRRDERGVPHIEASCEDDLYFAQGYATAQDRLWQMDFLRRTARGELCEVLGPAALEQDKLHRTFGFTRLAGALLERASERARAALEAYARGVNAFVEGAGPGGLPVEFQVLRYAPRPWTAADSLALGKLFDESLSMSVDGDILRALLDDLPPERREELLPATSPLDVLLVGGDPEGGARPDGGVRGLDAAGRAPTGQAERAALTALLTALRRMRVASGGDGEVGSNSWVAGGALTASGKPLIANDPHLPPTSPSIWHLVHLSAPGLKAAGVSVPGVPGVMIGHNERIAWALTNLAPDVQDIYFERFDEDDPYTYATPSGPLRAEARREEIRVRRPADGSFETVTLDVKVTRHGPVIYESGALGLALRWTALDAERVDLETFLALNRAGDWDEFTAALKFYGGPPQNFIYADTDGHIGYYGAGRVPVRATGDGSLPYDGAAGEGEWLGFVPFEEMPHLFDPPSGLIVTANQRVVGRDYPHHLTHNWRVPYRARRIHELLAGRRGMTAEDFLAVQGDAYSYPDAIFAAEVARLARPLAPDSNRWAELADAFDGWDGVSSPESKVMPLVTEMRKAFRRRVLEGALGVERARLYEWRNEGSFLDKLITERPADWLPEEFTSYEPLVLACYDEAREALASRLGPDASAWAWGRLASVRFPHPLEKLGAAGARFAVASFPQNTGGSMPTVNAGSRVSMRFVADLSDLSDTRLCIPLGESGDPSSVNRDDQLEEWRNLSPRALPFGPEAVAAATRSVLVMRPPAES